MNTNLTRVNIDLVGGAFGLILTLIFWFGRGSWSPLSAMFPNTVLIVMGVLSIALLAQSFIKPEVRPIFTEGNRTRIVVTAFALLLWVWAIPLLGFYLASIIVFTGLTVYIASASRRVTPRNVVVWVVVIALELAALDFIFSRLLHVQLPAGVFGP